MLPIKETVCAASPEFVIEKVTSEVSQAVPVLAWGLGMERILTDYYKIKDLRDIYRNDIQQLRETKIKVK